MIRGNKGEWSEYYAFLKLLVDRRLDFGGPGFNKLVEGFYSILKITRIENGEAKSYQVSSDGKIRIFVNDVEIRSVDLVDLKHKIKEIFKVIAADSDRT